MEHEEINNNKDAPPSPNQPDVPLLQNPHLFYSKLSEFHESMGLTLLSSTASAILDLYLFYKEVTSRGGFAQVSKERRWYEVASAMSFSNNMYPQPSFILQNVYANLLFQFELTYSSSIGEQQEKLLITQGNELSHSSPNQPSSSDDAPLKIEHPNSPPPQDKEKLDGVLNESKDSSVEQFALVPVGRGDSDPEPVGVQVLTGSSKQEPVVTSSSKDESELKGTIGSSTKDDSKTKPAGKSPAKSDRKRDQEAPRSTRSAYQFFLAKECDRLKKQLGKNAKIRQMVIEAWKRLPEEDRLPYIEESRKDRERFKREMTAYKERKAVKNSKTEFRIFDSEASMREFHNGYYVPARLEKTDELFGQESSMDGFTAEMIGNALDIDATMQIGMDE